MRRLKAYADPVAKYWRNRVAIAFLLRHGRPDGFRACRFAIKMLRACLV